MITEISDSAERVTAVMTSHMPDGVNFDGAIVIGFYPENDKEVFIRAQAITINVQLGDVDDLCRQLKRAKKIAAEQGVAP